MFGPVSKQRLSLLLPSLAELIEVLESQMSEPIGIVQGRRSDDEQEALYAQGRLTTDQVNELRKKVGWPPLQPFENIKTVTKARAGYSWHGFAMAVDVVPYDSAQHPDWNDSHPVWQEVVQKGEALGMVSGVSWHDKPHFQLTGRFPVTPTDEVRSIAELGGIQAVWAAAGIQAR